MRLILAVTWNPRGEMARLQRLYPRLKAACDGLVVSLPPHVSAEDLKALRAFPQVQAVVNQDWSGGRYAAVRTAWEAGADVIYYADLDRLLRWVETRPDEWEGTVAAARRSDCLIIGRTARAYGTHPQALLRTEAISNAVCAFLLGQAMDLSAGAKAFSRRAAQVLLVNCAPGQALGVDAEWPVILRRAGFAIDYLTVDGLDWESADRYRDQAADAATQRRAAEAYDQDPANWAGRVQVAMEIVLAGLKAARRPLTLPDGDGPPMASVKNLTEGRH